MFPLFVLTTHVNAYINYDVGLGDMDTTEYNNNYDPLIWIF